MERQVHDKDEVLRKLERLISVERSKRAVGEQGDIASLNEAEAFADKIQQLLLQHNLTISEVEFVAEQRNNPVGAELWDPASYGTKQLNRRSQWREELAAVVAHAHLCRLLVLPGSNVLFFVGREADRKCGAYAYGMLVHFAEKHSRSERRRIRRELRHKGESTAAAYGWREAWLRGFTLRVAERYRAMERAAVLQATQQAQAIARLQGGGTAPGGALVRRLEDVRQAAKDFVDSLAPGEVDALDDKDPERLSLAGLQAGYRAGDRVALGRQGLEDGGSEDGRTLTSGA